MPIITGPTKAKTGSSVTFHCKASSYPPSHYTWHFNGTLVASTPVYETPPLTKNMSGMYTCKAYNNVTGQNSTAYTMLTVVGEARLAIFLFLSNKNIQQRSKEAQERTFNFVFVSDPIEDVRIEASEKPPIEGKLYELYCNVTGPADYVYWMKNGMKLHRHNTTFCSMDNKTLTFKPLTRYDTGNYSCNAMNAVGNMTSALYRLLVNCEYNTERIFTADSFIHCSVVCHPALFEGHVLRRLVNNTVRACCFLCYCSWTRSPSHLWTRVC